MESFFLLVSKNLGEENLHLYCRMKQKAKFGWKHSVRMMVLTFYNTKFSYSHFQCGFLEPVWKIPIQIMTCKVEYFLFMFVPYF